ncbi:AEC family transporter [Siccirubricoccus sp. KC 17139]|uniref:AEC family transporter n=1 Tax=Siccirubricoccus soli TaxID=2899147 RepID=A0ABT1D3Y2_9PROT|nr:AEC family transporter [Siccirubricoccus soli]MCO6416626.1 AEC family transporter [Siccirubricoccus soli]MCP2682761.1 AEC family transporter [Siccirubricoccus soli]
MILYLNVFLPPFGMLLAGVLLRRWLLREEAVWAGIERLVFWALLPSLLVSAIAAVDLSDLPLGAMALAIWLSLLLGGGLSLLLAQAFGAAHPAATSVFQGGIRFNQLMGFAIAAGLYGPAGTSLGAVATGLIVPCVQVLTTLVFALGRPDGARPSIGRVARQLATNPLLLACLIGFTVSALGGLPPGIRPLLATLGQASIALGLLCVGAALSLATLRDRLKLQLATALLKLLLMPALTLGFGHAFGLEPLALATALVFMALPTATTSYVMARAMGGDAKLMAAIITLEHLLSAVTLPAMIALLGLAALRV